MSVAFYMEVVDRLDARGLRWTEDRRANRFRCNSNDLQILADALETIPGPVPAMSWFRRAGQPDGDNGLDIDACFSPAAVGRELDEIRHLLGGNAALLNRGTPLLDAMRDVCNKALARNGLVCCLHIH